MVEIYFTTAGHREETLAAFPQMLRRFEQSNHHTVRLQSFAWNVIWNELAHIAIHRAGPDVSEVGTSWIGSLVEMEALRPFTQIEIASLGGRNAFIPAAWTSASMLGGDQIWSIPFQGDARVVCYWKDMLQQVGIVDEANAFRTPERMKTTLELLRQVVPAPWVTETAPSHDMILYLASWVWGAGGDFVSSDGQTVTINQPAALAGLKEYFGLHRFMPQDGHPLDGTKIANLFAERKVAAMMTGPWILKSLGDRGLSVDIQSMVGVALPPGPPFVGGTHLSVWRHSVHERDAIDLIRFLTLAENQVAICRSNGMLPARVSALDLHPYSTDAYYRVFADAMRIGRAMTPVTLWGMMEDKLVKTVSSIWSEITERPGQSLDEIFHEILDPLVSRLQKVILPT